MSASCLSSIEAFQAAPLEEVAAALLALAFPEGRRGAWTMCASGVLDEALLSAIPGVRGGGFTASPSVLAARMVTMEGVQALERDGLAVRIFGDVGSYSLALTRPGAAALA